MRDMPQVGMLEGCCSILDALQVGQDEQASNKLIKQTLLIPEVRPAP
jgi:hypothetical protein